MEIEILEEEKNTVKFKIKGERHTILNLLKKELFEDSSVEFAGYRIDHPLIDEVIFSVTTAKKDPKKAVKDAIARIQKQIDDFHEQVKKIK